jgi:hypothetical protein
MPPVLTQEKSQLQVASTSEIYVRGNWVQVPALEVESKTIVVSGGRLKIASIRSEEWLEKGLEDPERCVRMLKEQRSLGFRADIFTFTQKPPVTTPKYKYPVEWDSVAVARVPTFKQWWESLPQESRKNVRRSQKRGVLIAVRQFDDHLIKGLVELNNDNPVRQGRRNAQFGKTFDEVKKDYSSFQDRSDYICAYHEDELIGFLKIVYRGEVASILNLTPSARHFDKRPTNALVAKAFERSAEKGVSYVTYGLFNYGNKRDSPLREFKIRNGFEEMLIPRYYVPLTSWGKLCMKAKFHRGLLGILPHNVIMMGINLRSKWYSLKTPSNP